MEKKTRRRPFDTGYVIDRTINQTDTLIHILDRLDRWSGYTPIPTNWFLHDLVTLLDLHERYARNLLGELTCARPSGPQQLINRFTFGGELAVSEVRKYYRTKAGDDYMAERGRGPLPHHLHNAPIRHEYFGSLVSLSIDFGMREDGLQLGGPREIFPHPKMGEYDPKEPYTFLLSGGRRYTHDNHPRVARYPKGAKLLMPEWDLDHEGIGNHTGKVKASIEDKFEKIVEVLREPKNGVPLYQKKYGTADAFSLFATTNEEHARNVKNHIEEKHGPQENILIKAFPGFKDLNRAIPVTTEAWDGAWMRPGLPDFYLNTLSEKKKDRA